MRSHVLCALIIVGCSAGPSAISEPDRESGAASDARPAVDAEVPTDAGADANASDASRRTYPPWIRQFGGSRMDEASALTVDGSGNVYVAGSIDGVGTNGGTADAFVYKYDPSGALLWAQQFGSTKDDFPYALRVGADGSVYVAGATYGSITGDVTAGVAAFIRKFDAAGGPVWTRQFGTGGVETARSLTLDAAGNVYVAGTTRGTLLGQTNFGSDDAYVRKYDPMGTVLWTRQFGSSSSDYCSEVGVDGSGNIYVTGTASQALPGQTNAGGAYVQTYDALGNFVSTLQFGTMNHGGLKVHRDVSGALYVTGLGVLPGVTSAGSFDAVVLKYNSVGTLLWSHQFGASDIDSVEAMVVDASGSVFVAGFVSGSLPEQPGLGEYDAFVRKYDASGNLHWSRLVGTSSGDGASAIVFDGSGGLYLAGTTYGALNGQQNAGNVDAFVMHLVP